MKMKKLIFAAVACAFIASPALANEFNVMQTKVLDRIDGYMVQFKDDPAKMDFLTQKKQCTEKAADIEQLKTCLAKFPIEQLQAMVK